MNKKFAVCSVVNRKYIDYLKVFSYSLVKHNPSFSGDYVVFYEDGDLVESDFEDLRKIYSRFVFRKVPQERYKNLNTSDPRLENTEHSKKIMKWTYYRLEMFDLDGYDFAVWFDTDMLVMRNLDELFSDNLSNRLENCVAGVEDLLVKKIFHDRMDEYLAHDQINGGVLFIGKNVMCKKVYEDLIGLLPEAYRFKKNDQSMFIEYFGGQGRLEHIDYKFNVGRKMLERNRIPLSEVHILHYPGQGKPTNPNRPADSHKYWFAMKSEMDRSL